MAHSGLAFRAALFSAVSLGGLMAGAAFAQEPLAANTGVEDIVVTAQRQAQSLQDVPIAVSAFSAEALEKQQINNTSDLQLALPNVTFTKGNFTGANFTIRGVGDAAVATSGDTSLGIHVNDIPLSSTRLFETDYFDMERIEVLRGPQGTLFGRNATSGVLNFITAKPDLTGIKAKGSVEYGNYNSWRMNGMVNVPLGDKIGVRVAGTYLKRDGFTDNLFTGNKIDGRDQWALRGTLRFEPTDNTTIDIIGYHFKEDSNRSRIQKQLCHRDPTGVLGCLPDRLAFETLNNNATLGATLSSKQFFKFAATPADALIPGISNVFAAAGLNDVYGADSFANAVNPADFRTVNIDYEPTYKADETHIHGKLQHDFGAVVLNVSGGWSKGSISSRTDYNLAAQGNFSTAPGSGIFALKNTPFFANAAARLFQGNNLCVSEVNLRYVGYINGECNSYNPRVGEYDESNGSNEGWSVEAHIDTKFDGPINFLFGGIYLENKAKSDYFVASSGLDYGTAVIGALQSLAAGGNRASASPFFNSETQEYKLKAYGIFGEAYWEATDTLKFTGGLRYSNDKKFVRDRSALFNIPVLYGTADANGLPGFPTFREKDASFDAVTGRFVVDWKPETSWSDATLVYASYSRGYKAGGINPPFDPKLFTAPDVYSPEFINAFEIGMKNTFLNGVFRANLTGFYYDYKDLQISRIINRTSFNDNTDAEIYGLEGEFIVAPTRNWLFNVTASYLHTKVKDLELVDTRNPSAGFADTVVIKDLQGGANCIARVVGNPALANAIVGTFNAALGLRPPVPIPGVGSNGAFSSCSVLASTAANPGATPLGQFVAGTLGLPFNKPLPLVFDTSATPLLPAGIPVDVSGNRLPNSPEFKISVGAQYTWQMDNGWSVVTRGDLIFTDSTFSRTFNLPIDRVPAYEVVNAQIQVNSPDDRFFIRGFIQNAFGSDAITGQYITDPSSGLFTNVFTLEPRRFGVAAGFSF